LSATFVSTVIIIALFGAIVVLLRKRFKKKQKKEKSKSHEFDSKYDGIKNEFDIFNHERIDYDALNYDVVN